MRRHVKIELLKTVRMLMEASNTINENIGLNNIDPMVELLVDCQQSAIGIGEKIESFEGEGTVTVSLLEEYCEIIYQLSLAINDSKKAKKLLKLVSNLLYKISNSIINDIPDSKKEVVFLPYKASMWDSLESVWKAASKEPDWDVFVVPIPYYDKNSDGTLGKMHYEGNDFPEYVPITAWEDYDISKRCPDVVYIHNPYDNANKITSIHPKFYAREIKKYTGLLVYIPYFVTLDDVPRHLCVLPGTMYADRVVVASNKEKKIYIEEFKKFENENKVSGYFGNLEEKFIALGSPKIDKVQGTTRDNIEIPAEWERLITKSDGTRKIVILYNTSIQILLDYKELYLEKIQDVLNFFDGKRDEYTLLWRPHPLMDATISSMLPEQSERYREMVNEYRKKAYGIFDDTPDIHRAIALSDAYYGDSSSIVALYKETGKPYMIQDVKVMLS